MNRFAIERSTQEGWISVSQWCEDIHTYYNSLKSAVDAFDNYMNFMNDQHHACTCRLVLIGKNRKTVLMTESTL